MTGAQALFLIGFTLVLVAVLGFAAVVVLDASRTGSASYLTRDFFRRLQRSSADRAELDRWAFYAHRVTGFAVFAFLLLHVVDVSLYSISRDRYDDVHELYGSLALRLFECGLLFAILFHTFNGLRLLGIDLANLGVATSRRLLALAVALTILGGVAGSIVILKPAIT
ncbi:MAG: succinate dehydrogenase / fumarate reductase, cytochrome b subunit [Thermomicrobiales bacterium]|jgi:succinate dehydrogenase / fumarate reductase cytochrome b subunit|nr:succinate dehydrogenase / fumarate reductase, cytochrome b subunit [Thermomicrobiales bacterium]